VQFNVAMNGATLSAQTTAGACSGTVQLSLDDFVSCVAFASAAPIMSSGNTVAAYTLAPGMLVNRTYKIRVLTSAQDVATTPLATTYVSNGFTTMSPNSCDGSLVISQVYGGGGNTNATYANDFIELHNRGTSVISLTGMSVQYASATGTTWAVTALSGSIAPGGYYLVREATGGAVGAALPTPDATGNSNMAVAAGKVALVNTTTALPAAACPPTSLVIDVVSWGATATACEGALAPGAVGNATSVARNASGCLSHGDNSLDFALLSPPTPRNSTQSGPDICACVVQNESNVPLEADYCVTQFPQSLAQAAGSSATVYGRIYESGVTPSGGTNTNLVAQVGYGPANSNPEIQSGWTWINATYNAACSGCGNNDEFQASLTLPAAGSYSYVYRFSLDQGTSWTVCDNDGAGSNAGLTFDLNQIAPLTSQ
jgi:hypothetical protein